MDADRGALSKKSDAEWKKELDPLQHHVLRNHGTERPFTMPAEQREARRHDFRAAPAAASRCSI